MELPAVVPENLCEGLATIVPIAVDYNSPDDRHSAT